MTETTRRPLSEQLTRVIAINLICLVVFIAFCVVMTLGSPSLLRIYWIEHRATSVVVIMSALVLIPGAVGLALSEPESWRR